MVIGAGWDGGVPAAGCAAGPPPPGLYQDFCWTLTQMRVLATAAFDQINVVVAIANQSSFMRGSLFASPVVQPVCQRFTPRRSRARRAIAHNPVEAATPRCQKSNGSTARLAWRVEV